MYVVNAREKGIQGSEKKKKGPREGGGKCKGGRTRSVGWKWAAVRGLVPQALGGAEELGHAGSGRDERYC